MAISPQQLTIYLYSAHRAVIFAKAQLSCFSLRVLLSPSHSAVESTLNSSIVSYRIVSIPFSRIQEGSVFNRLL